MTRNIRYFSAALLVSLPVWWTMNVSMAELQNILYWNELAVHPIDAHMFAAQVAAAKPIRKGRAVEPVVRGDAAYAIFLQDTGKTKLLYEKNSEQALPIASITKLMTALITLEEIPLTAVVSVNNQNFYVQDALYSMLIESNNDMAGAFADFKGQEYFMTAMNARARELGLTHTSFKNPSGLDLTEPPKPSNYSSAKDISEFVMYLLLEKPDVFDILSQQSAALYTVDRAFDHTMLNTNILISHPDETERLVGGKTGWTPLAQGSLVYVVKSPRQNGYIISVVLGSNDRFGDIKSIIDWTYEAFKW
jgi:serine-type D-Ala-D-Ala carboxypeptidase (penicillin-binding protein 5/6)